MCRGIWEMVGQPPSAGGKVRELLRWAGARVANTEKVQKPSQPTNAQVGADNPHGQRNEAASLIVHILSQPHVESHLHRKCLPNDERWTAQRLRVRWHFDTLPRTVGMTCATAHTHSCVPYSSALFSLQRSWMRQLSAEMRCILSLDI